jgi:hypothetical protein
MRWRSLANLRCKNCLPLLHLCFADNYLLFRAILYVAPSDQTMEVEQASPMMHFTLRRGHRSPQTLLLIDERDAFLREAATFFPGLSDRETARRIRSALARYQGGRWRRERTEATCPGRCRGLDAVLWRLLKVRDHVPSEMTVRRLFLNHKA